MMQTPEEFLAEHLKMLENENVFQRLLREAKEDEEGAEWYFDNDALGKAASWYHTALVKYTQLIAYAIGSLLGLTPDEVNEQWAKAER